MTSSRAYAGQGVPSFGHGRSRRPSHSQAASSAGYFSPAAGAEPGNASGKIQRRGNRAAAPRAKARRPG